MEITKEFALAVHCQIKSEVFVTHVQALPPDVREIAAEFWAADICSGRCEKSIDILSRGMAALIDFVGTSKTPPASLTNRDCDARGISMADVTTNYAKIALHKIIYDAAAAHRFDLEGYVREHRLGEAEEPGAMHRDGLQHAAIA